MSLETMIESENLTKHFGHFTAGRGDLTALAHPIRLRTKMKYSTSTTASR